jgi:PAS domain S-box-containing protein
VIPEELRGRAATEQTLRERAESRLASTEAAAAQASEAEVRRLLHELQVHQIELELQNEELRSAQVALSLARDRYNDLYDFAPVGYLTLEEDTRILEANFEASKLLGVERSRLIGSRFTRFVSLESVESLHRHQRHVLTSGTKQRCGLLLRRLDGTQFPVQLESIRMMGADQLASRWQLVIVDVSERKEAEAALHKFMALADQSSEFVGLYTLDFVPTYVNSAGLQMVGLDSLEQALTTPVAEFYYPDDQRRMMEEFFPQVLREGRAEMEIRFRHFKTGEALWMLSNVFVIQDAAGRPAGLATTSRKITER